MEITGIEAIPVTIPLAPLDEPLGIAPYVDSHGATEAAERVLVRLDTDAGVVGWGETHATPSASTMRTVIDDVIEPELVGRSVADTGSLDEDFFFYYVDMNPFLSGVEMAMWDALGKSLGAPVHDLLGGRHVDEVPFAFALGIMAPDEARPHVRAVRDQGFDVLKTTAGNDWEADVERIAAMHDEVNGKLEFRLDANQEWGFEEAVRVGAKLEQRGIHLEYLEQPVRIDSFGTLKRLRERLQTPIAANEDTYFPRHLLHLVREDAIDVAGVDLIPAGGFLPLKKLAAVAEEAGVSLTHHCGMDLGVKTAAILHAVASTPAINLPPDTVYYALVDDVIESPFEFDGGALPVPTDPGLGVTVDEDAVERFRTDA